MSGDGERPAARYRFGPLERRGLIAGWRGGQIAAVAAGVVAAVVVLDGRPTPPRIALAAACVGLCTAVAWWPLGGRTAEQWLPTVVRWGTTGLSGRGRRRSTVAGAGHCLGPDGRPCLVGATAGQIPSGQVAFGRAAIGRPGSGRAGSGRAGSGPGAYGRGAVSRRPADTGAFGGLRILGFRPGGGGDAGSLAGPGPDGGSVGIVHDGRTRTYTVALSVLGHSFALLGTGEKDRRVGSWSAVLGSMARERSVLHRLQWVATTVPDDGAAVAGHLAANGVLPDGAPALRSYRTLLRSSGAETCRHEVLLAVQLRVAGSAARAVRSLGGGDRAACAVLWREVASLRPQLASADMPVEQVLDERALAAAIRRSGHATSAGGGTCPPCGVGWPWPVALQEEWGCVRADNTWHATYWIAEWPRVDVGPEFLAPLLLGSVRRSVAVVMEPLSPTQAVRQAERARTADIADAELRRRGGFLATARRAKEAELASRREAELADGHASFRFSGYVTVSAPTKEQLGAACDATEQAASQCRLELRRLYGDQQRALTCTLPLGRGLS